MDPRFVMGLVFMRKNPWMYYQIDTERGHLIGDGASKADQSVPWPTSLPGLACLRGASCGHMPVRRNCPQCSDPPRTPPRSPLPPHRSPWPPQPRRGFAVGHEEPSPSRVPPLQRTGSFDLMELGAHPSRRECTRTTRLAAWRRTTLELPNAPVSSRSGWQLFANTNSIAPSTFNGAYK